MQLSILRFALKKSGNPQSFMDHDSTPHLEKFNLLTITSVHKYHNYLEIYKLLNGYVRNNELFSKFEFRSVPHSIRTIRPILNEHSKSALIGLAPSNRLKTTRDQLGDDEREVKDISKFKKFARSEFQVYLWR
ncbi:hypothetical protein QAD02_000354 [Eretmocerus hayati]|uniref:Uncharacterized protein n=1 Tax=Eretmocerus hayati TaxID=131215 RepID=A0ACC2ND67_9HYME|nr:hypothetical protein QAD02_000354 [Eretmocerus hayati]